MSIQTLGEDRFLRKDPNQDGWTKDAVYTALNPAPKRGDDLKRKVGRPKGSEEDSGAPNVLTGTRITSCFIQTSELPSRIQLQGNDETFFDDTFLQNGVVVGDTSRIVFTHASAIIEGEGFILEKRASELNTYDNVLSLYGLPPRTGAHNFMFIGRDGRGATPQFNTNSIHLSINDDTAYDPGISNPVNGIFEVEYEQDTVFKGIPLVAGSSRFIIGPSYTGYSSILFGGQGGISGLAYVGVGAGIYMASGNAVTLGLNLIPDADATYDIGSASFRIKNIYLSGGIIGAGRSYAGFVNSTANSNVLPSGWSASVSTATYTITHNLGTVNYGFAMTTDSHSIHPVFNSVNSNTLVVEFRNSAGTAFATNFYFLLTPI